MKQIIDQDGSVINELKRDDRTGAIIVSATDRLISYQKTQKALRQKEEKISHMEKEIAELKTLVHSLISDKNK